MEAEALAGEGPEGRVEGSGARTIQIFMDFRTKSGRPHAEREALLLLKWIIAIKPAIAPSELVPQCKLHDARLREQAGVVAEGTRVGQ